MLRWLSQFSGTQIFGLFATLSWAGVPLQGMDGLRILKENCFRCHGEDNRKGGLVLTSREMALKGGDEGKVIDQEKPEQSRLLKIIAEDGDPHMPPKKQLTAKEIQQVTEWLSKGATWNPEILAELPERKVDDWQELPKRFHPVGALATSPDGTKLAAGRGKAVELFELSEKDSNSSGLWKGHRDEVRSLAWNPNGKILASGGFGRVLVRNGKDGKMIRKLEDDLSGRISGLTFAGKNGEWLVVADGEPTVSGRLVIFNTKTWERTETIRAHGDSIYGLTTSPNGKLVATASADKLAKLWTIGTWKSKGSLEGHTEYVMAAAFSPDGERIATAGADAFIKAWKVNTRKEFSTFSGRQAKLPKTDLLWKLNPTKEKAEKNDDWIVTVGADGTPRVFTDLIEHEGAQRSTGAKERAWTNNDFGLTAVAFSKSNKQVITGDVKGVITVWDKNGKSLRQLKPKPTDNNATAGASLISFRNDVLPILSRSGCAGGSCHAKAGGRNGFQLSIFSFDPKSDHREIVWESGSRRVMPAAPEESLLLRKPTQEIDHEGGKRFEKNSAFYKVIRNWIAQGAPYSVPGESELSSIVVTPAKGLYKKGEKIRLKVTARYSDESERDVTRLAEYQSNDEGMASVNEDGLVSMGQQSGEGVVIVRYIDEVAIVRLTLPVDKLLPENAYDGLTINNEIDRLVYSRHKEMGLLVSKICTDSEFIRRASLDTVGKLPKGAAVRKFLEDKSPEKRKELVDALLTDSEWADYWAIKFGDLLRPNIQRVGVKPVYLMDRWIRRRFRENVSYDDFVRELLTAEGSSHEYGPIALYRHKREPADAGAFVSRIFLGVRLECAKCHHHPNEKWSQDDYYQMAAFFGSMKRKGQGISAPISGEPEYWWFQPGGEVKHPVSGEIMLCKAPDGPVGPVPENIDPRKALLEWMLTPENPFFAQAVTNRIWAEFLGFGIVHPVDDFRASNPPSNGPLLEWLGKDFIDHDYDLKHLMRRILNSRVYQASSIPNETNARDERNYARSLRRRYPAEVMAGAVAQATGISEKFDGLPPDARAMTVWNTSVDSLFLDVFGRPDASAEAPCERDPSPTIVQSLHLMNSEKLQSHISDEDGRAAILAKSDKKPDELVEEIYLELYARFPSDEEQAIATKSFEDENATRKTASEDLIWALINTPEFVLNH